MPQSKKLVLLLCAFLTLNLNLKSQNQTLGRFEYQTAATERMGMILDLLPYNTFKLFKKSYSETTLSKTGSWSNNNDTIVLKTDSICLRLFVRNEDLISTLPHDSILNKYKYFGTTNWTRTKGYYENGKVESIRRWNSIKDYSLDSYKSGVWIYYYEDQSIKAVGRYKKGKKKGRWFYFNPDGSVKE